MTIVRLIKRDEKLGIFVCFTYVFGEPVVDITETNFLIEYGILPVVEALPRNRVTQDVILDYLSDNGISVIGSWASPDGNEHAFHINEFPKNINEFPKIISKMASGKDFVNYVKVSAPSVYFFARNDVCDEPVRGVMSPERFARLEDECIAKLSEKHYYNEYLRDSVSHYAILMSVLGYSTGEIISRIRNVCGALVSNENVLTAKEIVDWMQYERRVKFIMTPGFDGSKIAKLEKKIKDKVERVRHILENAVLPEFDL